MSLDTIVEIEKMVIGLIDQDAQHGRVGRLKMYNAPDTGIDAAICAKYLDYFNSKVRPSITQTYRMYEQGIGEEFDNF